MQQNKQGDRLAVIDLGSNTFHLLIVEKTNAPPYFKEIYRERQFIYISADGLEQIPEARILDALICIRKFKSQCDFFDCDDITAVGTAALRTAGNGEDIIRRMLSESGIQVSLIDGVREAELIYKGTSCLDREIEDPYIIMDIGGGSVEYIVGDERKLLFSNSYPTGISVIRNNYKLSEPARTMQIKDVHASLRKFYTDMFGFISEQPVKYLIGSSGPFEIIESINNNSPSSAGNIYSKTVCQNIAGQILTSDVEGRAQIKGMPVQRADLSKESFILISFILDEIHSLEQVVVSPFALKEGIIAEKFNLI